GAHVQYVLKGSSIGYVNGLRVSAGNSKVILDATTKRFLTVGDASVRIEKAGYQMTLYSKKAPISWNVAKAGIVGDVKLGGLGFNFLGLEVPELTRPVKLTAAKSADLSVSVTLPFPFSDVASASLALHFDNTDGLRIDSFVAALGDFSLGPFGVKGLTVAYERQGSDDVWKGALTFDFPGGVVAGGHLALRDGSLDELSLFLEKENPGFPVGCCVYLTYLSGAYDGTSLKADAHLTVGPSIGTPWGSVYLAAIKPATLKIMLHTFFIHFSGDFRLVGKDFGSSWAWLSSKGFAFAGALNDKFTVLGFDVIEVGVIVEGSFQTNGSWFVGGHGSVCVMEIDCASGDLAISNKGAAGCIHVLGGGLGGYVRWGSGDYGLLTDCGWGLVKSEAGAPALRRSPQGSSVTVDVTVPAGATRRLFRIAGRGGAPRVLLVGPDGRRIEASAPFADTSGHVVVQDARQRATYVVVRRPAAGRWRISELPGSAAIARVGSAGPLPDRLVKGSVRPAGAGRILEYELAGPRHLTVTFVERGPNLHRVIGKARGRKGSLRFFPAEVSGRARRIEAVVESQGIPTRTEVVARFRVPPLRPLPAPMISLTRRGSTVVARWLPVNGAIRYHALVTPGDGRTRFF
ncbi:MAG: hypothetical protein ACRELC_08485, partial [Gemmatimonadota bacterium]